MADRRKIAGAWRVPEKVLVQMEQSAQRLSNVKVSETRTRAVPTGAPTIRYWPDESVNVSTRVPSSAGPTAISTLSATDADGTISSYTVSSLPPVAQAFKSFLLKDGAALIEQAMG